VARLSGTMGNVKIQLGEPAAGLELFQQQLAMFEALGDTRGRGQAESNIGVALGTMGRNEEAGEAFQRSRELMEAAGYAPGVARAYNNAGLTQRNLGNYGGALEALGHPPDALPMNPGIDEQSIDLAPGAAEEGDRPVFAIDCDHQFSAGQVCLGNRLVDRRSIVRTDEVVGLGDRAPPDIEQRLHIVRPRAADA